MLDFVGAVLVVQQAFAACYALPCTCSSIVDETSDECSVLFITVVVHQKVFWYCVLLVSSGGLNPSTAINNGPKLPKLLMKLPNFNLLGHYSSRILASDGGCGQHMTILGYHRFLVASMSRGAQPQFPLGQSPGGELMVLTATESPC